MPPDMLFVFVTIGVAAVLFASNRVRLDVVAIGVVLAMMLSGILTPAQSISGFGNTVVLLVAGLLVVGEMLDRTGVAQSIGNWIIKTGGQSETRLLVLIMLAAAILSSVMSSTAVVAIFIPIVFKVAANSNISASRLLMPMAFAAMISGMLTLIATTPNLVVSSELESTEGYESLGFFSFMPIGLTVLAVGVVYILLVRGMLVDQADDSVTSNDRPLNDIWEDYQYSETVEHLRLLEDSELMGKTIGEAEIEAKYNVRILLVRTFDEHGEVDFYPQEQIAMSTRCVLLVSGSHEDIERLKKTGGLEKYVEPEKTQQRILQENGLGVILVHPDCRFRGQSVPEIDFKSKFGVQVVGIRRNQEPVQEFSEAKLKAGDTLLVVGPWKRIARMGDETHDFVLLEMPAEYDDARPAHRKSPVAIGILLGMVVLSASGVVAVVTAVMLAAFAAILTKCVSMDDAYRSMSWSSLVLLAGMLPVADALDETGGTEFLVNNVVGGLGSSGPYVMMTVLFFLTAGLSLFLSNTASAVLIAPVAIQSAAAMDVSAYPFAITVLIASSAAFASPVASPIVTLVMTPGGYRFLDYVKIGGPLMLLTYVINLIVTPMMFPL